MNEDIRYLKKNIKTGNIDVHPTEKALIVNYEMQATIFGETGYAMGGDRKECQKIIRVRNLDENTNIPKLAKEIIDNCKLIQANKLPEVEHLLTYLLNRKETVASADGRHKLSNKPADPGAFDSTEIDEIANLNEIDDYLELLYEDIPEKLRASALLLQLARNPDNLEELYDNGILIGALARVLKDDWKESTDLATNIIYIFFCFSSFSNFHEIIIHFKIGAHTMNIINHELKKADMWLEEIHKKKAESSTDLDKTQKKYETNLRKQEQLFRVSYYLLLNIAEDVSLEVKMLSKNLIEMLAKTLERKNTDLLILVVSFFKKLSIYQENIPEFIKHRIVERLSHHIPHSNADLLSITVRLIYNLSFNTDMRMSIVKAGLLNKMVDLSQTVENGNIALCILYNISCEDRFKPHFIKTDCIPFLMKMILDGQNSQVPMEALALAINLVCEEKIAIPVSEGKGLRMLMKRAYKKRDYMIMKMLRNISQHSNKDIKMRFVDYISDLAQVITDRDGKFEHPFIVECVGILSNLTIPDLDFELIMTEFNLVDWIKGVISSGGKSSETESEDHPNEENNDDLLLEVIMLIGTIANDDNCAKMIADSGIIQILITLITAKQEDDEMVCQIVYVFYQLIFHESTRNIIIEKSQAPAYIIDLMHDKNSEIRKVCDWTLDIISEFNEKWADKIQQEKFRWFNSQWLEMIETGNVSPSVDDVIDPDDPIAGYWAGYQPAFDASSADDLFNRYNMLMNPDAAREQNVMNSVSPNLDSDGIYTDEYGRPVFINTGAARGYSGEIPYERPENQPGFRPDMMTDVNMLYASGGAGAARYPSDDEADDQDYAAQRPDGTHHPRRPPGPPAGYYQGRNNADDSDLQAYFMSNYHGNPLRHT